MTRLDFRRFARPDVLKRIDPEHLRRFLRDVGGSYISDVVDLDAEHLDYDAVCRRISEPGSGYPDRLADALFYADDFARSAGAADELKARADQDGVPTMHASGRPLSIEDLVVTLWSADSGLDLVREVHAEYCTANPRSFESFYPAADSDERVADLSETARAALEADLDEFFRNHRHRASAGPGDTRSGVRVIHVQKQDAHWYIIRLPAPWERRIYVGDDGTDDLKQGHPEEYHVLIFHPGRHELSIHAQTKTETTRYRDAFGTHLFSDKRYFSEAGRVSLEPLRTQGRQALVVEDIEGVDQITLVEVEFVYNNALNDSTIRKSADLFASFEKYAMPKARMRRAVFKMTFAGERKELAVRVYAGARSSYSRESTHDVVKDWLVARGFLRLKGQLPPAALRGLWDALVGHGEHVFTKAEWKEVLGESASAALTYLEPTGAPVPSIPCGLGGGQGCRRLLVAPTQNGVATYACGHDEQRCESGRWSKTSAAAYRITVAGVVDALAAATTDAVNAEQAAEPDIDLWSLGTREIDGTGISFWFTRATIESGVESALTSIRVRRAASERLSVLLLPSTTDLPRRVCDVAPLDKVHLLPLDKYASVAEGQLTVDLWDFVWTHRSLIGGCDPHDFGAGRYELVVDPIRPRYWFKGRLLKFGIKAWGPQRLLESLANHPGEIVSFEVFRDDHPDKVQPTARASFAQHMTTLRKALDDSTRSSDPPIPAALIETVAGGYRLNLSAGRVLPWSIRGQ